MYPSCSLPPSTDTHASVSRLAPFPSGDFGVVIGANGSRVGPVLPCSVATARIHTWKRTRHDTPGALIAVRSSASRAGARARHSQYIYPTKPQTPVVVRFGPRAAYVIYPKRYVRCRCCCCCHFARLDGCEECGKEISCKRHQKAYARVFFFCFFRMAYSYRAAS